MKKTAKKNSAIKRSNSKEKAESKKPAYSFGYIEEVSYEELLGLERGQMLQAFGQVCYCGMYSSDPYNCSSGYCDNRC